MTDPEKKSYEKAYITEKYPGSSSTPGSMINALTSSNPSQALKAQLFNDPTPFCVDIPPTCEEPWIYPKVCPLGVRVLLT